MAEVLPFRGIRYAASRASALSRLIAPPYDVISPAQRDELASRSPHNIVHLDLGPDLPGDAPGEDKYVRAARAFGAWMADGALRQDATPSLYPLEQVFTGPDRRQRVRRGFVAACRLQDYADGLILPHEKTLSAPKADRLELLKAVRANLSPVFGLYEDDHGEGQSLVEAAIGAAGDPVLEADSDDGTHHRLWRVDDAEVVARLRNVLANRKVLIADGHHRYESALLYRDMVDREQPGLPALAGHRFIMAMLCSVADPGLVIYPTHRLVVGLRDLRTAVLVDELAKFFTVETLEEDVRRPAGRAWAVSRLAEHSRKTTTFLMVSAEDRKARILILRDDADLAGVPLPASSTRELDVTVLHSLVLQHVLGISPRSQELGENVRYEVDAGEAVTRTLSGESQLGFLVNPTPMWQVQMVAEGGETMPQKSTFFYPKIATGLVLRKLEELG